MTIADKNPNSTQYGKVPYALIDSGAIATMSRSDLAVYVVIAAHVNGRSWTAHPTLDRIRRLAGVSERTAQRSIKRLVSAGHISVSTGGGRGRSSVYTIHPKGCHIDDGVSTDKGRHLDDGVSNGKPRQNGPQTPSPETLNPVKTTPKPRHPGDTPTERRTERKNSSSSSGSESEPDAAAAPSIQALEKSDAVQDTGRPDSGPDSVQVTEQPSGEQEPKQPAKVPDDEQIRTLLIIAHIRKQSIARLMAYPHISPAIVKKVTSRCKADGKGAPIVIEEIESACDRVPLEAQAKAEKKAELNRLWAEHQQQGTTGAATATAPKPPPKRASAEELEADAASKKESMAIMREAVGKGTAATAKDSAA